jgi:hypothetical protein
MQEDHRLRATPLQDQQFHQISARRGLSGSANAASAA